MYITTKSKHGVTFSQPEVMAPGWQIIWVHYKQCVDWKDTLKVLREKYFESSD